MRVHNAAQFQQKLPPRKYAYIVYSVDADGRVGNPTYHGGLIGMILWRLRRLFGGGRR